MKAEIETLYLVVLKYKYTPNELMELRYSEEASDRMKYEMVIISTSCIFSKATLELIETPGNFSDFIESVIVLPNHLDKEKFYSLLKI